MKIKKTKKNRLVFGFNQTQVCEQNQNFTHKSVEHLVEHRAQAPPVHGPVVRLLLENFRSQVLWERAVQISVQSLLRLFLPSKRLHGGVTVPQVFHRRWWWFRWDPDLLCRVQSRSGQCVPVSPTGCSQASGPCRESSETHYYSTTPGRSCDFDANHSFVHQGVPWDRSLPVDNVQGVEVAERAGDFSSVKAGSRLQEDPLPLEVVEELQEEKRRRRGATSSVKHGSSTLGHVTVPVWDVGRCDSPLHR